MIVNTCALKLFLITPDGATPECQHISLNVWITKYICLLINYIKQINIDINVSKWFLNVKKIVS